MTYSDRYEAAKKRDAWCLKIHSDEIFIRWSCSLVGVSVACFCLKHCFQGSTGGEPVSMKTLRFMWFFFWFLHLCPVLFWLKLCSLKRQWVAGENPKQQALCGFKVWFLCSIGEVFMADVWRKGCKVLVHSEVTVQSCGSVTISKVQLTNL